MNIDEELYSPSDLAEEYNVSASTITRLYKKYQKTNEVKDLPRTGQPRLIEEREERQAIRYLFKRGLEASSLDALHKMI